MTVTRSIKLNTDSIRYIGLFESLVGVVVKDVIINDKKILFVVKEGHAGMAIGKKGINIKNLQGILNKKVEVIEFSQDPLTFLNNVFRPLKINNAYMSEKSNSRKVIKISFNKVDNRMRVNITPVKVRLKKAKFLIKKYFDIDDIILA